MPRFNSTLRFLQCFHREDELRCLPKAALWVLRSSQLHRSGSWVSRHLRALETRRTFPVTTCFSIGSWIIIPTLSFCIWNHSAIRVVLPELPGALVERSQLLL